LISKARNTGICKEEDIRDLFQESLGPEIGKLYYKEEKRNLNTKPINQQRALWLNKEWAIERRIAIHLAKLEEERKKQEKLKAKKVEAAVTQAVEDPDKQPILKAHKNADHDTFFFCQLLPKISHRNCCW